MERKILFENKNLRLEYVQDGNYVHETWWGSTTKDVFSELLTTIIENLNNTKSTGLLLDTRGHKGLGPESQALAAKKVGEYAKSIGKLKEAIIVPKDVFSNFSVKNYSQKIKSDEYPVETIFFDELDKAEEWLRQSNN